MTISLRLMTISLRLCLSWITTLIPSYVSCPFIELDFFVCSYKLFFISFMRDIICKSHLVTGTQHVCSFLFVSFCHFLKKISNRLVSTSVVTKNKENFQKRFQISSWRDYLETLHNSQYFLVDYDFCLWIIIIFGLTHVFYSSLFTQYLVTIISEFIGK